MGFVPDSASQVKRQLFRCDVRLALERLNCCSSSSDVIHLDRRVVRVLRMLDGHMAPLKLKALAYACGISQRHLGRLFIAHTGISFHQYLWATRMRRSAELLKQTRLLVKQVAAEAGYIDPSNFGHDFRRFFNCSPEDYRQRSDCECLA